MPSQGEILCSRALTGIGAIFKAEYRLPGTKYRYDFWFLHKCRPHLLEFDGKQHFKPSFGKGYAALIKQQETDRLKTRLALERGYSLIRIDYRQIKRIREHIEKALMSNKRLYLSTPVLYRYLFKSRH